MDVDISLKYYVRYITLEGDTAPFGTQYSGGI